MKPLLQTMTLVDATFAVNLTGIHFLPVQAGLRLVKSMNQKFFG